MADESCGNAKKNLSTVHEMDVAASFHVVEAMRLKVQSTHPIMIKCADDKKGCCVKLH